MRAREKLQARPARRLLQDQHMIHGWLRGTDTAPISGPQDLHITDPTTVPFTANIEG